MGSGSASLTGTFSQSQGETTSWSYNAAETYQPPSTSGGEGSWQATSSSGSTVDSGGGSFSYLGGGSYGGNSGNVLDQSGWGSESFSYRKNYSIDSGGNWQVGSGSGGASGSGATFSSYTASGGTASGSNNTSYSFGTTATYNGGGWTEGGNKPRPAAALRLRAGATSSYSYTEQAALDANGTWQNTGGTSSVGTYTSGGTTTSYAFCADGQWRPSGGGAAVNSLVGLATASWPALVDAVWGMGFTADSAPKTPFAVGNVAGAATAFTSEKMKGADAVFGSNNVAPVVPVTDAALLAMYGLNGVSAAPAGTDADVAGPMDGADAEPAPTGGGGTSNGDANPFTLTKPNNAGLGLEPSEPTPNLPHGRGVILRQDGSTGTFGPDTDQDALRYSFEAGGTNEGAIPLLPSGASLPGLPEQSPGQAEVLRKVGQEVAEAAARPEARERNSIIRICSKPS